MPRAVARLHGTILSDVLPVWLATAHDAGSGHFHEGLALDGGHLSSNRLRIRTAARMIHVYADAARLGLGPPGGLAAARAAAGALERDARHAGGGYVRAIGRRDGTVADPVRDLYDQSCVLLAFASLHHATGERVWRDRADALLSVLDAALAAPQGGWAEDDRGTLPRRQNPHMHMFEALLALAASTGAPGHLRRLAALGDLLEERFVGPDGLLCEHFGPEWERGPAWRSERLEPGHMAEWAWLLQAAAPLTGRDRAGLAGRLIEAAHAIGRDPRDPRLLLDEVDAAGTHLGAGRRLWSQIEYIKGSLSVGLPDVAEAAAEAVFESYLADAPRGLWRDAFDARGEPAAQTVPASSCYHLWTLAAGLTEAP